MSSKLRCPKCSFVRYVGGKDRLEGAKSCLLEHFREKHLMSKRESKKLLDEIFKERTGQSIEEAIKQYDEFIKSGVFVERTDKRVIL